MLSSSINRFSSCQFLSSLSITSALLTDVYGRSLGKNYEHTNVIQTVFGYGFENVCMPEDHIERYRNFTLNHGNMEHLSEITAL